jgi:hypothetical protein
MWAIGDRMFETKQWTQAAGWYLLSAHPAFRDLGQGSISKSLRKAALCHIQQGEYAQASSVTIRCSGDECATHYVAFLASVTQGSLVI